MPFNPNGTAIVEEDAPDRLVPEDHIFKAEVVELKGREVRFKDRRTGEDREIEFVQFFFEIRGGDYDGRRVRGEAEFEMARNSKLMQWCSAILKKEYSKGEPIDFSAIPGQVAEITVRHRPDKNDPDKKWVEVDEVMTPEGALDYDNIPF